MSGWTDIRKTIEASEPFTALRESLASSKETFVSGLQPSLLAIVLGSLHHRDQRQHLIVTAEDDTAEEIRDDLALIFGDAGVFYLGHGMGHKAKALDMSSSIAQTEALNALCDHRDVIITASARSFATKVPLPSGFATRSFELRKGEEVSFEDLLEKLSRLGFERKDFVEEYGDVAVRGGIVDIYPFVGSQPIRAEFWGDTIESLREFDATSQRSIQELVSASIVAGMDPEMGTGQGIVLDYLKSSAILTLDEPGLIKKELEELASEGVHDLVEWDTCLNQVSTFTRVTQSLVSSAEHTISFGARSQPTILGSTKQLVTELSTLTSDAIDVYIGSDTAEEAKRLVELIEEEEEQQRSSGEIETADRVQPIYKTIPTALHTGFVFPAGRVAVFAEHEVFGRRRRRGPTGRKGNRGLSQKELQQLRRGDYVVHQDYGIGTFIGLQKISVRGVEQEVMKLSYAEGDAIYVNLNYVNRVQKYSSREGHVPTISRLGSPEWDRLKARANRKVKDIARDLIKLYAKRKHERGHAFAPDAHWQKEMEASFMYEDTPDQATATGAVKADMEEAHPMDRLICGDVGFGKTEVAVRAAFKAVLDGKQVAMLVPTTILAKQHYLTFLDRLGRYGARVESLSRLKTKKEQTAILETVAAGGVDILIGTHRILSKDVAFKDLGLLIIDEEHRFGVGAKEKLRHLKVNVDTMTLTATPIPRTLQFSLMGARDLSLITTAPRNRLPIITEIVSFDKNLIREAILHEKHRGGQVYFINDRVHDMEEVRAMLERTVPEVRMGIAHGQMDGRALERVIMDFLDRKYDLLICTKIIESGIDIPSVNTIIVNRADRFGLAELYQLRGRVGRSNVQAYAYLMTPPIEGLPRQAIRRLQALQEFTELGSGFNLAMRDLEIRGAGNLLGGEQSGFILEMGFEMYQRIVAEAVGELREAEFSDLFPAAARTASSARQTLIESDIEALIPDIYIESDAERLDVYRRLYAMETIDEVSGLRTELRDRFGEFPEEVDHLLQLVDLKIMAGERGLRGIELDKDRIVLTLPPEDERSFYEAEGDERPHFQFFIEDAGSVPHGSGQLKQYGKTLKFEVRNALHGEPVHKLAAAREVLQHIRHMPDLLTLAKQ